MAVVCPPCGKPMVVVAQHRGTRQQLARLAPDNRARCRCWPRCSEPPARILPQARDRSASGFSSECSIILASAWYSFVVEPLGLQKFSAACAVAARCFDFAANEARIPRPTARREVCPYGCLRLQLSARVALHTLFDCARRYGKRAPYAPHAAPRKQIVCGGF